MEDRNTIQSSRTTFPFRRDKDSLNSGGKGKMEQRRKALEKVSWEEMMKKLRGLFSQLSRRALPLGPELHKYTRNGFYTERGNEM